MGNFCQEIYFSSSMPGKGEVSSCIISIESKFLNPRKFVRMQNALIFSPDLDGHRQVYVFVMSKLLEELGFNIILAADMDREISNSFYIDLLKINQKITIVNTSHYKEGGLDISLAELIDLQTRLRVDLTIFPEADNHIALLISQIFSQKRRLRGRTVGIFMRPFYFYRKSNLSIKLGFLKQLPTKWNKDTNLFYEFFHKRFSLLDVSLSIDENFVNNHPNFTWMPDVFQKYAEVILKPDEKSLQRIWIEKLKAFKEKNKDRFLFLYFGTTQYRKGYDILLQLAKKTGGCFIHCGLRDGSVQFSYDINRDISILRGEGRFFETNEYIDDPLCIEYFFRSVSHLVLPYRDFHGSSGVMLQALEYRIPVLAPDNGIIGHLIKKYHLGMTYSELIKGSLEIEFNKFKYIDPKIFENDIRTYMNFQSAERLKTILVDSFTSSNRNISKPVLQ